MNASGPEANSERKRNDSVMAQPCENMGHHNFKGFMPLDQYSHTDTLDDSI